jgi:cellulose synthase (UDP-forming)
MPAVQIPDAVGHLPEPPTDTEKYSYFTGRQRRWPFVWLFVAQAGIVFGFVMVMKKSPDTALCLIFLTFMIPPMFVNLWLRLRPHRTRLVDHLVLRDAWAAEQRQWASVDVFLPCCGEDLRVLANTFESVRRLEWPGVLTVHVLDDGASDEVARLAAEVGFVYHCRPNRGEYKKAGNMIHGFQHSAGDFIAVFDADFCPRPDFFFDTLPYMDDPAVGIVQTAQYFDVDPTRVNYFARYAGSLQELFFRWIQPARDTYQAAICAGTNVVYRRQAVVAAGGFAKVPLGEDVHSGVKLWVANFRTRYVPLVLAKGLAPDSWAALTNQQYRWCRSSMLLMVSQFFKDAPFSRRQRLCFWAAFLYYMSSAALVLTSVLPTLFMVWLFPEQIHWTNYVPMVPGVLATFLVFPRLARGWDWGIYRVCTVNTFCHVLACVDALRQRVQAWIPTGAAAKPSGQRSANTPRRVAILLRSWLLICQTLLWTGIVRDIGSAVDPAVFVPAIVLGGVQLLLLGPFLWRLDPRPVAPAVPLVSGAAIVPEPVEASA